MFAAGALRGRDAALGLVRRLFGGCAPGGEGLLDDTPQATVRATKMVVNDWKCMPSTVSREQRVQW
jgi:hypothetical protein